MDERPDETWAWYARAGGLGPSGVGNLRIAPDVEAASVDGRLWLRGRAAEPDVLRAVASIGAEVFSPGGDGELIAAHPPGRRVPTALVPDAAWRAIADVLPVHVEAAALAGTLPPPVELSVVRGGPPREPAALRVSLARLVDTCCRILSVRPVRRLPRSCPPLRRPASRRSRWRGTGFRSRSP